MAFSDVSILTAESDQNGNTVLDLSNLPGAKDGRYANKSFALEESLNGTLVLIPVDTATEAEPESFLRDPSAERLLAVDFYEEIPIFSQDEFGVRLGWKQWSSGATVTEIVRGDLLAIVNDLGEIWTVNQDQVRAYTQLDGTVVEW